MTESRQKFVTQQPGKAIWTVAVVVFTLARLPFWLICFIPRRFRQHPQWTYRQAIMSKVVRAILYNISAVEMHTPLQLTEKDRFVTISPSSDDLIYRGLLDDADVQPTLTGGTWYPSLFQANENQIDDEQTVVLHFHGGAYVVIEGRSGDVDFGAKQLTEHLNAKALFLSYRLASNPHCHFPAALQDAVTAYQYLLDQGVSARRIVISGDSAGANLAIALLRHIARSNGLLPDPLAALLFSPWLDLASARDEAYINGNRHYKTDYLPSNFTSWGARAYIPKAMEADDPYISPLHHPFRTETPLWIQLGGLEILYDEGMAFADAMDRKGNRIEVYVEPFTSHDILYAGNLTGFEAETEKVVKLAGEFVSRMKKETLRGK